MLNHLVCKNVFLIGVILILFSGCVTQSDIEYLQKSDRSPKSFKEADIPDYRLKPKDELYIQITSLDEGSSNVFNGSGNQQMLNSAGIQPYGASLVSYTINADGLLTLPIIGNIIVKDKTLAQVREMIKDSLSNILNQPSVSVKLVNRYISVLGEVRNPGHFSYSQENLSVFDALGLAGDLTKYSDRKEITLARNENGTNMLVNIDLTRPDILESKYYYIRPNDMLYVKPLKKRIWGLSEFPFSILLSTISTALLVYTVVK